MEFGVSTAAAIFVLLAGISFALKHEAMLGSSGLRDSLSAAVKRAAQIWIVHLATFVVAVAALILTARQLGDMPLDFAAWGLGALQSDPGDALAGLATLTYQPRMFDILPLYIVLVLAGPLLLSGLRMAPAATFGASLALYAVVQAMPAAMTPQAWFFNPLAWQLLFVIGLCIGMRPRPRLLDMLRRRLPLWVSITVLVAGFGARRLGHPQLLPDGLGARTIAALGVSAERLDQWSACLHPIYLIHVLAAAHVLSRVLPGNAPLLQQGWCRQLQLLSRHSLEIFALGIVLAAGLSEVFLRLGPGLAVQALLQAGAFAMLWLLAWFISDGNRGRLAARGKHDHPEHARERQQAQVQE